MKLPGNLSLPMKLALAGTGLLGALLLFLWLALPRIIHSQAEKFVAEKTGHRLSMDRPAFNPFTLSLRLAKLRLATPDDQPLLSFDNLLVDLSAASLPKRALVFDAIHLDGLAGTLVELPGGTLNWTPFLDALKSKEPDEKTGLPRLDIRSFVLANGRLDFADRRTSPGFATRVEPLELTLSDISTLPDDSGKFSITAQTSGGARLALDGAVDLDPLKIDGRLNLQGLQLAQLGPYLKNALPVPPEGVAELSATYHAGNRGDKLDAAVEQLEARLTGLRIVLKDEAGPTLSIDSVELKNGRYQLSGQEAGFDAVVAKGGKLALLGVADAPAFASLSLEGARLALAERSAAFGKLVLAGGRIAAGRDAGGRIDLLEAFKAFAPPKAASPEAATGKDESPAWRFRLDALAVDDLGIVLRDAATTPAAELALDNIALQAEGISHDLAAPLPVRLSFDVRSGGRFESEGKVVPAEPAADFRFKLTDLALKPAQPYLTSKSTLTLADGRLSTQGRASHDAKGPHFRGEFALRDLRLMEPGAAQPLLAWKTFGSRALTLTQHQLDLGELRLIGLDAQLIIDKDKNINLKKVLKTAAAAPAAVPPAPTSAGAVPPTPAFRVNIDRIRFDKGEMDFADYSLVMPFATRIHNLRGNIGNLSNVSGAPGQMELDGDVDDYGLARAVGQVDLFRPTEFMDLRVVFRNVEMTRLTPYTATFAGRKIDSGKLSLDLQYKIKQRQLQGENQVIMERLTLGERVESPTAKDLPLDLAVAILQDSAGRIDLGLPVSGDLDDPQFSYGQIVWKAITNVITKIVTAPFRALAALFGGGEAVESIAFDAGAAELTPPEREKLVRLAGVLAQRPGLALKVGGNHAEADRVALQDVQLRRAVAARMGQRVAEKGDPGPLSTRQPKVQEALEALYKDGFGAAELAALKEGFRKANPGQLEESVAGKMMSRLSGMLREKKTLGEDEVAKLKGADFHALLYERLRARERIAAERLAELAQARAANVSGILAAAGVAAERVQLLPPEQGESSNEGVPIRLTLEPAKPTTK